MTTAEFRRATTAILGFTLTFEQATEAMRTLVTASRRTADVVAEWAKSARGAAVLKAIKGQERYEKRMARHRVEHGKPPVRLLAEGPVDVIQTWSTPLPSSRKAGNTQPNPRLLYDLKRLREKRAGEIERESRAGEMARDLDAQGKRTRQTSLPVPVAEPITIQNASTGAKYDVEKLGVRMDGGVDVEARKVVDLDGQEVRVAETPEQVISDEALYGAVAVELKVKP